MKTFVLSEQTANSPIDDLVRQASSGGVEIHDMHGNVVAYILSPSDREAWTYAEANLEVDQHLGEIQEALNRRGGITTSDLLTKAAESVQATTDD